MTERLIESEKVLAFVVLVVGLVIMVGTLGFGVWKWAGAADVTAVLTAMGSVVGSLVGAFFGLMTGAAGKNRADKHAELADAMLGRVAAITDASLRQSVDGMLKEYYDDIKNL